MRFALFTLLIFLIGHNCCAQQAKYTAYTVKDGLPSNNIYKCIEDTSGFLWVATDAGIARFDGKRFQVFTTAQNLPDNEVLSVLREKNGTIWINTFKQNPTYFDGRQNRFVSAMDKAAFAKVSGTVMMAAYALPNSGVVYYNENTSLIFKNNKYVEYSISNPPESLLLKDNADGSRLVFNREAVNTRRQHRVTVFHVPAGNQPNITDSAYVFISGDRSMSFAIDEGKVYFVDGLRGKCAIVSNAGTKPFRVHTDSVAIGEQITNYSFTPTSFYLISHSGKIYVFDKRTLKLQRLISGDYLPNCFYDDSKGNLWISTIDKGLIVYRKNRFAHVEMPGNFTNTNFISIARKPDGTLLAGNYYGYVVEWKKSNITVHKVKDITIRQRKIILAGNNVFTFSDEGVTLNYNTRLSSDNNNTSNGAKTAIVYNDSIIIAGHSSRITKLNYLTLKMTTMPKTHKRITAMVKDNRGVVYFGSTDGLFRYDYEQSVISSLAKNDPLLTERIVSLCATPDSLLWAATPGNGILILKNDRIIGHLTTPQGIVNDECRSIIAGRPGQIWLGTAQGISIINYKRNGKTPKFAIQNLTVNDGLTDNLINEMVFYHDTVSAATGNGISLIPANTVIPKFNIPVKLVRMSVNQRDTTIANEYQLAYHQQNIQMQFAGVEINGHFKYLQYTLDKNQEWTGLDENTLTIQLGHGTHILKVRAVDVNGNISNNMLTLKFDIATPFWKSLWFWLCIALLVQMVIVYQVNRYLKKRRELKLAKEIAGVQTAALEQQAFTSLMNPHFMFNALNSIQHYINVQDRQNANRYLSDFASLIRKNFEAAQQSFIPLDQEIENIKIYLRLEQMRFNERFSYQLTIDDDLETDDWMIPTMILQPLLENALLHGIMPSAIDGKILIDIQQQKNYLFILITDNGIGIENSLALKQNNPHKSHGTELIKKRITALSHFGPTAITVTMAPAFASGTNPGNKITLAIPMELYDAWQSTRRRQ